MTTQVGLAIVTMHDVMEPGKGLLDCAQYVPPHSCRVGHDGAEARLVSLDVAEADHLHVEDQPGK